jgi:hypothetical protein
MNYLSHALPFLSDPYFVAGTAVPDWLSVVDRKVRVRARHVETFLADPDPLVAALAGGLAQHFRDDARFHESRAFAETSMALSAAVRDALPPDTGFRPSFLGHVLVEVLLDWALSVENPDALDRYYAALTAIDPLLVQTMLNRFMPRPTERLVPMIFMFRRERVLCDYAEDAKLLYRMNQVMQRVGFSELPGTLTDIFSAARQLVSSRRTELLAGIPA